MPASHILVAIGAGVTGAILFATLLTGSFGAFILAYLAPLPLFAVGLSLGAGAAAIAAAAGTLATLAVGSLAFALAFGAINAAPAVIMSWRALLNRRTNDDAIEWYPPGAMVIWLAGMATAAFFVLLLLLSGAPGGLEGFMTEALSRSFREVMAAEFAQPLPDEVIAAVARYLPGVVAVSWITLIAINGSLAQGLLVRFGKNRRPSPHMADIDLPGWLPLGAAIAAAGAFMPGLAGFVGGNLLFIALATFAFAGLAVIHTFAGTRSNRLFWLVLIYSFTIVFTWPAVLIAVLGVADTSLGLRRRLIGQPPQS